MLLSRSEPATQAKVKGGKTGSYTSGQRVPATGIYEVRHREHRVPHEVTLLKDHLFPPCAGCDVAVQFKIVRVIEELDKRKYGNVVLHVLPVIEEELEDAA